jgi:predicted amino acid racemase
MNRITIDVDALAHNYRTIKGWVERHEARLTVVTKALCGHQETLRALAEVGVDSMADSRLSNLEIIDGATEGVETWYLRPPHRSALTDVVRLADVSLNTELDVIMALNEEGARQGRTHGVVVMIELGDLREGILPGSLLKVYRQIFELENVRVLGIGANLGCLGGAVPSVDQLMQLVLYRELLELKFERKLPLISAGTSAVLPLLVDGVLPKQINHFRIGEAILLGTDPVRDEVIRGLRGDTFRLDAEVVEIKEKSLVPVGETSDVMPFAPIEQEEREPGERGYRAIVTVGQLDTDVGTLKPIDPGSTIVGASSDLTVVHIGDEPSGLSIGDVIGFRLGYASLVRLMANPYTEKLVVRPDQWNGGS